MRTLFIALMSTAFLYFGGVAQAQLVIVQIIEVHEIQALDVAVSDLEFSELASFPASLNWETGIMNALFDRGYIVSNAPLLQVKSKALPQQAIELARETGANIYLPVFLSYSVKNINSRRALEALRPQELNLRIMRIDNDIQVSDLKSFEIPFANNAKDEIKNAERFGEIISTLLKG